VEHLASALVAVGFLVLILGILEIGGLFNVGVGLVLTQAGCVVLFADEARRSSSLEDELLRDLEDL
jgi:hypothetical protein